jgi:hypothetical protein
MGMSRQEAGSKGGRETLKRYGRAWMKELGKRGLRATANKYFAGSVAECVRRVAAWFDSRVTREGLSVIPLGHRTHLKPKGVGESSMFGKAGYDETV